MHGGTGGSSGSALVHLTLVLRGFYMLANTFDSAMFESMFELAKGVNILDQHIVWMSDLARILWVELARFMSMYE